MRSPNSVSVLGDGVEDGCKGGSSLDCVIKSFKVCAGDGGVAGDVG